MSFAASLASPFPTPRHQIRRRLRAAATPTSAPSSPLPKPFSYPLSNPSIRWPNLHLDHLVPPSPPPHFPPKPIDPFSPPPSDTAASPDEDNDDDNSDSSSHDDSPSLDARVSRTRVKKMSKLALKRARDWRDRVQYLSDRILSLPPGKFVADVLDEKPVQMTPTDYCFVVKSLEQVNWQRALEVYEWLNLRRWYAPNARMLATIISVLGRARQDELAEEIFLRAAAVDSSEDTMVVQVYNAMMGVYARSGKFMKVQELLQTMKVRGCEPDLISFNTLINARAKSGHMPPGSAMDFLDEVRKSGLCPDTITYNTLISACSHESGGVGLEEALRVYDDMKATKCEPDLWTNNAMISIYGRCGLTVEAEQLFRELRYKGYSPDAVTYNSLVNAFAREGDADAVEQICDEMVGAGFRKDEITNNTIIHMYGKQGKTELAFQSYRDMKLAGCKPDAITYTVLIDSLGKGGRVSEAAHLMSEMVDLGVKPTLKTYSALICGYAKAGKRDEAEKTFEHMLRSGIKPDGRAYSVMLDIILRSADKKNSISLYKDMIRNGWKPDEALYQGLLEVLGKDCQDKELDELVCDMRDFCGMSLKLISSTLVKAKCFEQGAEMLKQSVLQDDELDRENLNSILSAYRLSGKHEEACALLNFLKEHSPNSHDFISEASILLLCKKGQMGNAVEEYNRLIGVSSRVSFLNCNIYESLIASCVETESLPEACQFFSDLRFYCIKPSQSIYENMIKIYCKMELPETANYLLDQAEMTGFIFNDFTLHVTLIETYGKLKLLQLAESLVGKLRHQQTIGRKVWNALIYAYADSGKYEEARAVFNTMVKDGPSPTVESVNGLIQSLITDGRLEELYVVVQELQDMDFKISKSTILLMLDAFARCGNIFEVKKIYNGMKASGYLPSMHLYKSMISLFSRGKRVRDVEAMTREMEQAGFKPDLEIFNSLLSMYAKIEDFRKATEVYHRIMESGFQANEETYNSIIFMYSKDHRPEEGLSLLNEMKRQGLEPKLDTYKSLLAACGREHLLEQAEEIFECIQSKGWKLNRSMFHLMMKIYRDSGNPSKAESVLSLMKEFGVEPTIATMHILMDTYGTGGKPHEAENVLINLQGSGLNLSTLPYSSVIDAYLKSGEYNLAVKKLQDMKSDGVEPDHRVWTCFIRGASLCHQTSEVLLLLNSLRDAGFDLPIRLLTGRSESLVREVDCLLDKLGYEDNASFNFVNALEDLLWAFERRATASWIFQLAITKGIYRRDVFRVAEKDWGADFRKLSAGASLIGLTLWLDHMQDASLQGQPESPKSVVLITGTAEYHMVSLNSTLKAYLWEMGSPFLPSKTRTGILVAKAHSLRMWLKDSSFCMDLELKDAPSLPKLNTMQLYEGYFMRAGLVPAFKDIHERLGQVGPKKFARLALMSDERRQKIITADIEGRKQKLEKIKKRGDSSRARKATRLRTGKFMRRRHKAERNVQ